MDEGVVERRVHTGLVGHKRPPSSLTPPSSDRLRPSLIIGCSEDDAPLLPACASILSVKVPSAATLCERLEDNDGNESRDGRAN